MKKEEKILKEIKECKDKVNKLRIEINHETDLETKMNKFNEMMALADRAAELNNIRSNVILDKTKKEIKKIGA